MVVCNVLILTRGLHWGHARFILRAYAAFTHSGQSNVYMQCVANTSKWFVSNSFLKSINLQDICSTEIRTVAGEWNIKKGCQQKRACENNRLQVFCHTNYHANYLTRNHDVIKKRDYKAFSPIVFGIYFSVTLKICFKPKRIKTSHT